MEKVHNDTISIFGDFAITKSIYSTNIVQESEHTEPLRAESGYSDLSEAALMSSLFIPILVEVMNNETTRMYAMSYQSD